jgi:hypothetical protein
MFENMVLRKILWPKRERQETGQNSVLMNFVVSILHKIVLRQPDKAV